MRAKKGEAKRKKKEAKRRGSSSHFLRFGVVWRRGVVVLAVEGHTVHCVSHDVTYSSIVYISSRIKNRTRRKRRRQREMASVVAAATLTTLASLFYASNSTLSSTNNNSRNNSFAVHNAPSGVPPNDNKENDADDDDWQLSEQPRTYGETASRLAKIVRIGWTDALSILKIWRVDHLLAIRQLANRDCQDEIADAVINIGKGKRITTGNVSRRTSRNTKVSSQTGNGGTNGC